MPLTESCDVDMVRTFLLSEPILPGKDKNEDEQEDFTGLQYFKNTSKDFVITYRILQSRVLFAILPVYCSKILEG